MSSGAISEIGLKQIQVPCGQNAHFVAVTPDIARKILQQRNIHNRTIKQAARQSLRDEMDSGNWHVNGATLVFDAHGQLLDGQHRLWACANSGVAFESWVVTGVSETAQLTMDSGVSRNPSDVLRLAGFENTVGLSRLCRQYLAYDMRVSLGAIRLHPRRAVEIVKGNPKLVDACKILPKTMVNKGIMSLIYLVGGINHHNQDTAKEFIQGCFSGEMLRKGDPRLTYRSKLGQLYTQGIFRPSVYAFCALRAWNAFYHQEPLTKIHMPQQNKTNPLVLHIAPDRRRSAGYLICVTGSKAPTR